MPIITRNDVDPALTGALELLVGGEERRRYLQSTSFRDQQLAEQQRQFDAQQVLRQLEMDAQRQQQEWARGFQEQQLAAQTAQRDRALQADMADRAMRSNARLQEIGLQGDQQRAMYGDQIAARLAEEQMRQQELGRRQIERIASQLGEKRLTQILKQRDSDLHAIRTANLNEEQYDDAMSQFEEKYTNLGITDPVNLPMLSEQYSSDNFNPEVKLAQHQERYPNIPWQIYPDGRVGPPPGWKSDFDPEFRAEKAEHEFDLRELDRQRREADAAERRAHREEDRRYRLNQSQFDAAQRALERRAPTEARFTQKILGEGDVFDEAGYNAAMAAWQQEHDALVERFFGQVAVNGGSQQPLQPAESIPTVWTEEQARAMGDTPFIWGPTGRRFQR